MPSSVLIHVTGITVGIVLIVVSAYFTFHGNSLSLPISTCENVLALLSPCITILLLNQSASNAVVESMSPYVLIITNTILATLAANQLSEQGCNYHDRWQQLYHDKKGHAIKVIQDTLDCCGFRSTRDMAWPFKDREHGDDACEVAFARTKSCEQAWIQQDDQIQIFRLVLGIVGVGVVGLVLWLNSRRAKQYQPVSPESQSLLENGRPRSQLPAVEEQEERSQQVWAERETGL